MIPGVTSTILKKGGQMKILIDAGHGNDTPGKRSPDGSFLEYLWNRQVADLVIQSLREMGIDCDSVVTEIEDVPLSKRVARVNDVCDKEGVKNVILLSIHSNAAGNGTAWMNAKGWSCYTTPGQTRSDEIAECLYDAFSKAFPDRKMRKDLSDKDSDIEENFYLLRKTKCPAVLLENFFYDNREECSWLLQDQTKREIADAIVEGMMIYFSMP